MNGHAAFIAFREHYLGHTESNAQITKAENNIQNLHYAGNHHNFTLEMYTNHLKQYFTDIYNADHASAYTQDKQVCCLCTGIYMAILKPATGIILSNATYHDNFDNAMAFLHEYITLNIPKTHLVSVHVLMVGDNCVECVLEEQKMVDYLQIGNVSTVTTK